MAFGDRMRTVELCDGYGTESVRRVRVFPNQEPSWLATPAGCLTEGSGSASRSPRPRSGHTGDSLTRRRSAHRRRSRPSRRSRVLVARVRLTGPNERRPCSQSHGSRRACRRWWRAPPAEPEVAGGVVTDRINGHPITLFERGIVVPGGVQDAPGYLLEGGGPADERSELRR